MQLIGLLVKWEGEAIGLIVQEVSCSIEPESLYWSDTAAYILIAFQMYLSNTLLFIVHIYKPYL